MADQGLQRVRRPAARRPRARLPAARPRAGRHRAGCRAGLGGGMTAASAAYVSTGHLPASGDVQAAVDEAYRTYRGVTTGAVSAVYPSLSLVPPGLFGICLADVTGTRYAAGDAGRPFAIMSVAKPFVFALACASLGPEQARKKIGVNATGLPFSSLAAVERGRDGVTNAMVNPGAIAATSLLPGGTP